MPQRIQSEPRGGELVIYAKWGAILHPMVAAFCQRYMQDNIHVTYLNTHSIPVYERIKAEIKAGLQTADVVIVPQYMTMQMQNEGLLRPHSSDEFRAFPSEFYDAEGGWAAIATEPIGTVYNSRLVSENEVPTTLDELTDSRWRGKFAMQSVTRFTEEMMGIYYLAALKRALGEDKWKFFLRNLAERVAPQPFQCSLYMSSNVSMGSYQLAIPGTLREISLINSAGHTLGWDQLEMLSLKDVPTGVIAWTVGLVKKGINNANADRFFDFALSREWQKMMGGQFEGIVPSRPGVKVTWVSNPLASKALYYPTREEVNNLEGLVTTCKAAGLG